MLTSGIYSAHAVTPSLVQRSVFRLCQPLQSEMPTIQFALVGVTKSTRKKNNFNISSYQYSAHPKRYIAENSENIQSSKGFISWITLIH